MDMVVQIIGLTMMVTGLIAFGVSVGILAWWYLRRPGASSVTDDQTTTTHQG